MYILSSSKADNRRTLIINLIYDQYDPAIEKFISSAISEELRAKNNIDPPLEVLSVRVFRPFWTQVIKDAIENDRPPSILMTEIRVVHESEHCQEEMTLTFHDESLAEVPSISSMSLAMIDLLLPDGNHNVRLMEYLKEKNDLQVLVVLPPGDGQVEIVFDRRRSYVDALVLFLYTCKYLRQVFLPIKGMGLFELEDIEEIAGVLGKAEISYLLLPV